tara:strand:- start:105 stop:389 length:285 start_codon:yes stop_codon:yes gene_type:complete
MTLTMFFCSSASAASDIVSQVEAGELFGVDMGTTSKASSYSNYALVECTATRAKALNNLELDANTYEICSFDSEPESFTHAAGNEKTWYLRGKL